MTAQHGDVATGPGWTLHLGRWQEALAHVTKCDALITDPPYSERTHRGQRSCLPAARRGGPAAGGIKAINYASVSDDALPDVSAHWWVVFGDHSSFIQHEKTLLGRGLYVFQPVIWVKPDPTPRLAGDGPTSAVEYMCVARPKRRVRRSGSRPGSYTVHTANTQEGLSLVGRKPIALMRALIRDYTEPGDLVLDVYAGTGTTLLAAVMEGRRAIGAEMDPATFDKAVARLRKGFTTPLPDMEAPRMEQTGLDL